MSETSEVVTPSLQWLTMCGFPAWRNNTLSFKMGNRLMQFSMKGASDIFAIIPGTGQLLAVECKYGRGKLTPDQQRFLEVINHSGGVGLCVRSLNDLYDQLVARRVSVPGMFDPRELIEDDGDSE